MPMFTVEASYHLPIYRHRSYRADTAHDAARLALNDDDWSNSVDDHDNVGPVIVSGIWEGEKAAYIGTPLAIPEEFARDAFDAQLLGNMLRLLRTFAPADDAEAQMVIAAAEALIDPARAAKA